MSQYQPHNSSKTSFLDLIWAYKYYLAFYIVTISFLTFTVLYLTGGIPDELKILDEKLPEVASIQQEGIATTTDEIAADDEVTETDYPVKIIIDKIGINTSVSNPASPDLAVLNSALLKGAVRYPGSGTLGKGNMFIFGHSSGLKVVNNQAYKAFNNLKNLAVGDIIRIQSADKQYNYKVTSVSLVDSNQAMVTFSDDRDMLTLSTCNVFGQKQERYVVEATYVKSIALY
jgi:LPXTG-site transpeptidase (sortase) family protein